jgi:hypothetical protein
MTARLRHFLSTPVAQATCFIAAILGKMAMTMIYARTESDEMAQALMSKNFNEGQGFTINLADLNDLSQVQHVPFPGWPPGYSWMMSLLLRLCNNNPQLADYIIQCAFIVLFVVYLRKLLLLLQFPLWCISLFLLFQGFFIYTYHEYPTDFASLTLMLAVTYYLVKITTFSGNQRLNVAMLSFFVTAAAFTRYQYIPVCLALLIALTVFGLLKRKPLWIRSGGIALGVFIVVTGSLLLYQHIYSGSAYYLSPAGKGFYPENLLYVAPFGWEIFLQLHFYCTQLSLLFDNAYGFWMHLTSLLNYLLIVVLLMYYGRYLYQKRLQLQSTVEAYMVFGGIAALGSVALLVLLSVTRSRHVGPPHFKWTYVMELRYYLYAILFAQIAIWRAMFVSGAVRTSARAKWLIGALMTIVMVETSHGVYHIVKQLTPVNSQLTQLITRDNEPNSQIAMQFLQAANNETPDKKVVVASFEKKFGFVAGWYGFSALFTPTILNETIPPSTRPVTLLVVLNKKELFLMTPFLQRAGVMKIAETTDHCFYSYHVHAIAHTR